MLSMTMMHLELFYPAAGKRRITSAGSFGLALTACRPAARGLWVACRARFGSLPNLEGIGYSIVSEQQFGWIAPRSIGERPCESLPIELSSPC
jgi:hypothetical protein